MAAPDPESAAPAAADPSDAAPARSSAETVQLLVKAIGMLPAGERDQVYAWLLNRDLAGYGRWVPAAAVRAGSLGR